MENLAETFRIAQVVLGIGLVIFVHELGHFLAARWCGVRVEVFSLGLGPRLFGWKRGSTQYQVALLPLGGYCRMAGEERRFQGLEPEPDELPAKSVGQRFFIYSGGVLMNVLFGLVVFPLLFHFGMPFRSPKVGESLPGSPAWHARIEPGTDVVSVNGKQVLGFSYIQTEVALGDQEATVLVLRDPSTGRETAKRLAPRYREDIGISTIGIAPALERDDGGAVVLDVAEGSAAARAGLSSGDRLVALEGAPPGLALSAQLAHPINRGDPVALRVRGEAGERVVTVVPDEGEESLPPLIGVTQVYDRVQAVRAGAETERIDLREGDRLVSVQGLPVLRAGDLGRALVERPGPLELVLERDGEELRITAPALSPAEVASFAGDVHVAPDGTSTRVAVHAGAAAAEAGVADGDRIVRVDGTPVEVWSDLTALVRRAAAEERAATITLERAPAVAGAGVGHHELLVTPRVRPVPEYGFALRQASYVYRSESLGEAIAVGTAASVQFLRDSWLTLKRIVLGQVSGDNIGGIITIGAVSYSMAEAGWAELFFFLCMLSMNLAFLNVLPIPVLDGGHLFFLIVEGIKGSPVSERILGYSQMVGVVLILSLMVYVTYNDLMRWVLAP